LLIELQFELWIGDAAVIRTKRVRKQKTDRQDAQLLVKLLIEDRFPRIWVPDAENRDLRQLLWHRHRLVQMRTRIMNQLHVVALNEGVRRKKALWRPAGRSELESLILAPWAGRRRQDLLDLLDQLTPKIQGLTRALEEEVEKRPVARRLMTHPGVGVLTALAFELVIGTPERFHCRKQIASYVGLVPSEESSGDRRRLGHISKQGNALLRFLLVEAAQVTVRSHPQWRSKFSIWPCGAGERSPRWRWLGSLRSTCTGCGVRVGTMSSGRSSVRTRESPEIAVVCSRSPA
jgi:transposase